MRKLLPRLVLPLAAALCFSAPASAARAPASDDPNIVRSLELRERYETPRDFGRSVIYIDSIGGHHIRHEASTVLWKDEGGQWQWSQVSEKVPGGLLPTERALEHNRARTLEAEDAAQLDRLLADPGLYRDEIEKGAPRGIGAPSHVMEVITPQGHRVISWDGRLLGLAGQLADIALGGG